MQGFSYLLGSFLSTFYLTFNHQACICVPNFLNTAKVSLIILKSNFFSKIILKLYSIVLFHVKNCKTVTLLSLGSTKSVYLANHCTLGHSMSSQEKKGHNDYPSYQNRSLVAGHNKRLGNHVYKKKLLFTTVWWTEVQKLVYFLFIAASLL